ncbi:MAG: 1-aminocyclopropane-1-carboxylate deaminase/D-cysteine desulfhydrase [Chitinophagales bacterium]|nr:1-aminocyclopropane-1-carboxylate deaminase/D-cysteine desulfhydrase [Chitinophagales bacterium]
MAITPDRQPFIQPINAAWYENKVTGVDMLRLDVIHKHVSGNKWFKLKYNIEHCILEGIDTVLTFGGAYSNHLAATAAMANFNGIRSIGVIKGKYAEHSLTSTLQFCTDNGMYLHFVTNETYSKKNDPDFLKELSDMFATPLIIPEGGANEMGIIGAGEIADLIPADYTHIAVSVGTGSTLSGIVNNTGNELWTIGYAPMKGGSYLGKEVSRLIRPEKRDAYRIYDDWHFGGFGRYTDELTMFMNNFYGQNGIPLDMVYTAKMMFGLKEQILRGDYPDEVRILCIHTGGLQGNQSIADKLIF